MDFGELFNLSEKAENALIYVIVFAVVFLPSLLKLFRRSKPKRNAPPVSQRDTQVSQADAVNNPIVSSSRKTRGGNPMFPR